MTPDAFVAFLEAWRKEVLDGLKQHALAIERMDTQVARLEHTFQRLIELLEQQEGNDWQKRP